VVDLTLREKISRIGAGRTTVPASRRAKWVSRRRRCGKRFRVLGDAERDQAQFAQTLAWNRT
jgi:hypothetical protein